MGEGPSSRVKTVEWAEDKIRIIDQTRLPGEQVFLELDSYDAVAVAIKEMRIRGAPALGIVAAYAMALGAQRIEAETREEFLAQLHRIGEVLAATRPTAVNLFRAVERLEAAAVGESVAEIRSGLIGEARRIEAEEAEANRRMGALGAGLIEDGFTVLTHCNAGALATVSYGTALGVVRAAVEQGKRVHVFATETRPLLQGARLTAWELSQEGIPVTLIADTMTGHFLSRERINCVVVGADRIAANGDVANKIGTYNIAVLAAENSVPFYVAAPTSTIDLSVASGAEIPIEERSPEEVTHIQGVRIAPPGVEAANPAFDVTPHRYVSAIITENGIVGEPYVERLRKITGQRGGRHG